MPLKTVAYTIAIDSAGEKTYRNLAKLLAASVVRSGFEGRLVIFHNSEQPLFPLGRTNVHEEFIDVDFDAAPGAGKEGDTLDVLEKRWALKHKVAEILQEEHEWDRLLFLDADCLVTRPLAPLIEGDWQLAIYREPGQTITEDQFNLFLTDSEMNTLSHEGINSGVFCVDRSIAREFFSQWAAAETLPQLRRRCCLDQAAFNRVVLDNNFVLHDFSPQVSMPLYTDKSRATASGAVVAHWVGGSPAQKLQGSFGLFMETYFFDPSLVFFNLIEN